MAHPQMASSGPPAHQGIPCRELPVFERDQRVQVTVAIGTIQYPFEATVVAQRDGQLEITLPQRKRLHMPARPGLELTLIVFTPQGLFTFVAPVAEADRSVVALRLPAPERIMWHQRRQTRRFTVPESLVLPVTIVAEWGDETLLARLRTLSTGGCDLLSGVGLMDGMNVKLQLALPQGLVEVDAEVRHCTQAPPSTVACYLLGCQFLAPSDAALEALGLLIAQLEGDETS